MILWQRGDVWWVCNKLKAQYILFGKVYGYKTWKVSGLWWGKGTKPKKKNSFRRCMIAKIFRMLTHGEATPIINMYNSDHVITRSYVSNWKLNISFSTASIAPELAGRWLMVTGSHPWSHVTIWLWSLVMLNLYKNDTTIDKHDTNFIN